MDRTMTAANDGSMNPITAEMSAIDHARAAEEWDENSRPPGSGRADRRRADAGRVGLSRIDRGARRGLLGHPHRPGPRELPDHAPRDLQLPRPHRCARPREAGVGAGERRTRRARAGQGRHHRPGVPGDRGWGAAHGVPGRRHPGRCRHLDEHVHERGHRQPRPRAHGLRARPVRAPAPDRRRQPQPVDQRRVPDRDQARDGVRHPPAAHRAREAHQGVRRQGTRVPERAQDRPHAAAGRGADDPRPGVRRLRHDAARGLRPALRDDPVAERDQHGRHGHRHRHHRRPALRGGGAPAPGRHHRHRHGDRARPHRGHERRGHLHDRVGHAQARGRQALEDLQRPAAALERTAGGLRRDSRCRPARPVRRSCRAR